MRLGGEDLLDPGVEQAIGFLASGDRFLRGGSGLRQVFHGDLATLAGVPDLGAGEGKGEIDEFERVCDLPVLVRDLLRFGTRDVVAAKDTK